ncbi:tudor domain-containing protein 1-like [Episyrphus balteatus]|uniref:tudor domain-containing protein 1-like n=1 Tax=Episyrphus balteatus TaxID=286459 RepID=UPI002486A688|nr:tudor domain-containing protein 1-like [Episyrphus balteatus]
MKQSILKQILHPGDTFRVNIVHIENPQRFFVIKFTDLDELTKLEYEMDIEYSKGKQTHIIYFPKLHMCCALCIEEKWYRGSIEEINGNGPNDIRVRLVDDGRSITVGWHQLHTLKDRFIAWREFAFECSLADIKPLKENNYKWTDTTITEFIRMTSSLHLQITITSSNQFRYQVVLNVEKRYLDINLGGLLVKCKHALSTGPNSAIISPSLPYWAKLIQDDKQQTLTSWYENFKKTLKSLPIDSEDLEDLELFEKLNISNSENSDLLENSTEIVPEWLPAEPIEKTVFTAFPTYVDYDASIYLHDADKHSLLNWICKKNNEQVNSDLDRSIDDNWAPGEACLARYYLDRCWYRAVIQRSLPNNKFEVRFVDYGNIESCEVVDLYRMTPFANIPIQAVRFTIQGIRPKDGRETFGFNVLDLIHGVVVDKMCAVIVAYGEENKDVKKCSIRCNGNDLGKYLIKNGCVSVNDYDDE